MKAKRNIKSLNLIVLFGATVASLIGCAATEQNLTRANNLKEERAVTSEEYERSGDIYFNRGNLPMAFVQYERSLRFSRNNIRVLYKKGLVFLVGNMNEDAIKVFHEVIEREPKYALAYQGLGQAFFQMKHYGQAEKEFRKAIQMNPRLWKAHNFLGMICDYRKRYKAAIREYASGIALKPESGLLYNNLGVSYSLAGQYQKAINAFNRALERKYSKRKTYDNLGLALAKAGRYREAFEAFEKGGDKAQAYNNLGCMYLSQGRYEMAIRYFEEAIAVNPTFYTKASENLRKARMALSYSRQGK
jgi:tetratricopeptide (TPR) repeat protein